MLYIYYILRTLSDVLEKLKNITIVYIMLYIYYIIYDDVTLHTFYIPLFNDENSR